MKELKELVQFTIDAGHIVEKVLEDKKVEANELLLFLPLVIKAPEAFQGINQISKEWKESSFEQKQQLVKEIEESLNLQHEKSEKIIEASVNLAVEILEFINLIKKA